VAALLLDGLICYAPAIIGYVLVLSTLSGGGSAAMSIIALVLALVSLVLGIWNFIFKQGSTGQTIGKGVLKIKLVRQADGQVLGAGTTFVRQICHTLDNLACAIGYLWPLWDEKNQTFADKIMSTLVIKAQ